MSLEGVRDGRIFKMSVPGAQYSGLTSLSPWCLAQSQAYVTKGVTYSCAICTQRCPRRGQGRQKSSLHAAHQPRTLIWVSLARG